jgi:predicted GH43/DUF377 family glycosyl hydrolase
MACGAFQLTVAAGHRAGDAVFGPFDCENAGVCIDERGTEDPRLTYDAENEQYVLLYNAWGHKGAFLAIATTMVSKKTPFWRHFILEMIILPRQVRDKHREGAPKRVSGVFV